MADEHGHLPDRTDQLDGEDLDKVVCEAAVARYFPEGRDGR